MNVHTSDLVLECSNLVLELLLHICKHFQYEA